MQGSIESCWWRIGAWKIGSIMHDRPMTIFWVEMNVPRSVTEFCVFLIWRIHWPPLSTLQFYFQPLVNCSFESSWVLDTKILTVINPTNFNSSPGKLECQHKLFKPCQFCKCLCHLLDIATINQHCILQHKFQILDPCSALHLIRSQYSKSYFWLLPQQVLLCANFFSSIFIAAVQLIVVFSTGIAIFAVFFYRNFLSQFVAFVRCLFSYNG